MRIAESAATLREGASIDELIERPELVDKLPRTKLPAVMNHATALQAKAAALQSKIAARLLEEPERTMSEQDDRLIRVDEAGKRLGYRASTSTNSSGSAASQPIERGARSVSQRAT